MYIDANRGSHHEQEKVCLLADNDMWLGYLEEYPDYLTQGESIDELKENLKDIYSDLSAGHIPCVRRVR